MSRTTVGILVRVSVEERDLVKAAARAVGASMEAWVRGAIRGALGDTEATEAAAGLHAMSCRCLECRGRRA